MGRVLQKAMRIPRFGFAIEEQRKIYSLDQALEALTPAHQSKSTSAAFEDDHIVITKLKLRTPKKPNFLADFAK